jgi:hypothetical protein
VVEYTYHHATWKALRGTEQTNVSHVWRKSIRRRDLNEVTQEHERLGELRVMTVEQSGERHEHAIKHETDGLMNRRMYHP